MRKTPGSVATNRHVKICKAAKRSNFVTLLKQVRSGVSRERAQEAAAIARAAATTAAQKKRVASALRARGAAMEKHGLRGMRRRRRSRR